MVSHEDRKKDRIATMIKWIDSGKHKKADIITECIIVWGMSRRTVLEYIKVIEARHGIFE